ncbi:MAG: hypothetical protein GTO02_20980, partial [Candidatus Dadabacteria bacterium]|nr:hypothetical protein [Candidatus Dadabacteria bacterium]NIQ16764.1 hypothetical protein [Candidatus Dadabacteria bacterium]
RQAIINSNLNPGPDEIVFEEGLSGTIFLNLGSMFIQDDLTINGPGAERVTIDADGKSSIFDVNDFDNGINRVVEIRGLRLINADGVFGLVGNIEILTVKSCEFINGKAEIGGAILNFNILTVDSCLFENNSASFGGGAINNDDEGARLIIRNSEFVDNQAGISGAGAIANAFGIIELITNSTFANNNATGEGSSGGAILNFLGTIKEISHSTFEANTAIIAGGAIFNSEGIIKKIVNSTFT